MMKPKLFQELLRSFKKAIGSGKFMKAINVSKIKEFVIDWNIWKQKKLSSKEDEV